jgi:ATP-dependent DNA helicase RecQ
MSRRVVLDRRDTAELRPVQRDAVRAVSAGRDTVLVMPAGGDRSAVHHVAVAATDRPAVIVSPFIGLLDGDLSSADRRRRLAHIAEGQVRCIVLAPGHLASADVVDAVRAAAPALVVVDEAHRLSGRDHVFRPDLLAVPWALDRIGRPPILALTETAAPSVLDEIADGLELVDPMVIVESFRRPNIHLSVTAVDDPEAAAVEAVGSSAGRGIVHVATRAATVRVAAGLQAAGHDVLLHHAGMSQRDRAATLDRFGAREAVVLVTTSGLSIDIEVPDVRFVVHVEPPETIEAYYREIGRAGRDGESARALLLWNPSRIGRRPVADGAVAGLVSAEVVAAVLAALPADEGIAPAELGERFLFRSDDLVQALAVLRRGGLARLDGDRWRVAAEVGRDVFEQVLQRIGQDRTAQQTPIDALRDVLDDPDCRWQVLLAHFGAVSGDDDRVDHCGHCDRCDGHGVVGRGLRQEGRIASHT